MRVVGGLGLYSVPSMDLMVAIIFGTVLAGVMPDGGVMFGPRFSLGCHLI